MFAISFRFDDKSPMVFIGTQREFSHSKLQFDNEIHVDHQISKHQNIGREFSILRILRVELFSANLRAIHMRIVFHTNHSHVNCAF